MRFKGKATATRSSGPFLLRRSMRTTAKNRIPPIPGMVSRAFYLIELLVIIAINAILAAYVGCPAVSKPRNKRNDPNAEQTLKHVSHGQPHLWVNRRQLPFLDQYGNWAWYRPWDGRHQREQAELFIRVFLLHGTSSRFITEQDQLELNTTALRRTSFMC